MRPTARARVDQIIHMKRELVQLEGEVDLGWLDDDRSLDVSSADRRPPRRPGAAPTMPRCW